MNRQIIVGTLVYTDCNGNESAPRKVYFSVGADCERGLAFAYTYSERVGTYLAPITHVVTNSDGTEYREGYKLPGYAGMVCDYDKNNGTISNFRED